MVAGQDELSSNEAPKFHSDAKCSPISHLTLTDSLRTRLDAEGPCGYW